MADDTTSTTLAEQLARIASGVERIASALERSAPQQRTDPMAVDSDKTHAIASAFKERTGREF